MNTLYSILLRDAQVPANYAWYAKRTELVPISQRMDDIVDIVLTGVPTEKLAMFISYVCNIVLTTQYGAEISKLDPANTYINVSRPPTADHSDPDYCLYTLIQPADSYAELPRFLAEDIRAVLDQNSWFDLMGAACLQLLRETQL